MAYPGNLISEDYMTKIVNLTVHKNTKAKRMRKEFRREALSDIKERLDGDSLDGYFFVSWRNKDSGYRYSYNVVDDSKYSIMHVPAMVQSIITKSID